LANNTAFLFEIYWGPSDWCCKLLHYSPRT